MKHFLMRAEAPVPDLRASFDERNTDSSSADAAPALQTESLIISTYKTLITSQALTEIPIWWRNREIVTTISELETVETTLTTTLTTSVLADIPPPDSVISVISPSRIAETPAPEVSDTKEVTPPSPVSQALSEDKTAQF